MVQLTRQIPPASGGNFSSLYARPRFTESGMIKWKMRKQYGFIESLWWKWVPGTTITVKWPTGQVDLRDRPGILTSWESADPNDHYRPWLEKNIGRQGRDWQWSIGTIKDTDDTLLIKIRKKHEHAALVALIKWA